MSAKKYAMQLDSSSSSSGQGQGKTITISTGLCVVAVLLAVVLATLVGLIVHFAEDKELKCIMEPSHNTILPRHEKIRQCQELAKAGANICKSCPPISSTPTTRLTGTGNKLGTATPIATPTTPQARSTGTPNAKIDVRLPSSIVPVLYQVRLRPNMYGTDPKTFNFTGSVRIEVECKQATDNVTLHMNGLDVLGKSIVVSGNGRNFSVVPETDEKRQFLILKLDGRLIVGQKYFVGMDFIGPLKDGMRGLYLSSYKRGNDTVYLTTSQFESTDARMAFPCFDEPAIKAKFNIILERKSNRTAISNMPVSKSVPIEDDWIADYFETTPKMSTYLLAFIVCDFKYTEATTTRNVTYRAWARPEAVSQTQYALQVGVSVLSYYEDYFNISYPLPKLDMIALPDFAAGAMENWGLITYRETAMLYEPGQSSEGNKQRVAVVVAHELAHQWFGNLVSPVWWDEIWLNEGFASYMEYLGTVHVEPEWKMFEQFLLEDFYSALSFDGLISSHPIFVPVADPAEISEVFDAISYQKGASVIRMAKFFMGDSTFRKGLTNYLEGLRYAAASHDDLWYAWGNQSLADGRERTDVKSIMDTWVLQMNYPVVTVQRHGDGLSARQARFLVDPHAADPGKYTSPFGYKWDIPFTYTHEEEQDFNASRINWMNRTDLSYGKADLAVLGQDKWILANIQQYGYYRVNYDTNNWRQLIRQLLDNHTVIPTKNRAQIVNDAWSLARAGKLNMTIALDSTTYLFKEREYVPWVAAMNQLAFVETMLQRSEVFGGFSLFMNKTVETYFKELTMNNTNASHMESYKRSLISSQACNFDIESCVNEAKSLYHLWMNKPDVNPIDPGLRGTVYCTAIRHGGVEEWDFAYEQHKISNVAGELSKLRSGMACSSKTWILYRYLQRTLMPDQIRKQDVINTIIAISRNVVGRPLAWDFIRANIDYLTSEFSVGTFSFAKLIKGTTSAFNTEFDLKQLQDFQKASPNAVSATRAMAQSIEATRSNIKWMENNIPIIRVWLGSKGLLQ
ncbi:hypothetical protein ScPMuIL_002482 [Solemya velum]